MKMGKIMIFAFLIFLAGVLIGYIGFRVYKHKGQPVASSYADGAAFRIPYRLTEQPEPVTAITRIAAHTVLIIGFTIDSFETAYYVTPRAECQWIIHPGAGGVRSHRFKSHSKHPPGMGCAAFRQVL